VKATIQHNYKQTVENVEISAHSQAGVYNLKPQ